MFFFSPQWIHFLCCCRCCWCSVGEAQKKRSDVRERPFHIISLCVYQFNDSQSGRISDTHLFNVIFFFHFNWPYSYDTLKKIYGNISFYSSTLISQKKTKFNCIHTMEKSGIHKTCYAWHNGTSIQNYFIKEEKIYVFLSDFYPI